MDNLERQNQILDILKECKSATVEKLVKTLYVSQATVRRDLVSMAKRGLIKRTHGGAVLFSSNHEESSMFIRQEIMKREKREIATKCLDFIKNNESIFLDPSSTVSCIIPLLNDFQYLNLVTNGLSTATLIGEKTNFTAFVPGGFVHSESNSLLGEPAFRSISTICCDLFVFSCAGLSLENGIAEASIEQAEIKRIMVNNSKTRILLADSTKFGHSFFASYCGFQDVDIIITDKMPSQEWVDTLKKMNTRLVVCD